jgi:hypothetical protein
VRSVYTKFLLWSLGILIVSTGLFLVINRNNVYNSFTKDGDLGGRLSRQLVEARLVYETEGKESLARHLDSLLLNYPGFQYYLARDGRDLVTGEDRSRLLARLRPAWPAQCVRHLRRQPLRFPGHRSFPASEY